MLIYIHGFGGSGRGVKATLFQKAFSKGPCIAPSLSYVPDLAIQTLCELIETFVARGETVSLIGSSLGGYYALYLSERYALKVVLLNPSLYPYKTLTAYVGEGLNFYDESHFEWNAQHIAMLQNYEVEHSCVENILLLQQEGDSVIDYREAQHKLKGVKAVLDVGGSHAFENIDTHLKSIADFLHVNY